MRWSTSSGKRFAAVQTVERCIAGGISTPEISRDGFTGTKAVLIVRDGLIGVAHDRRNGICADGY